MTGQDTTTYYPYRKQRRTRRHARALSRPRVLAHINGLYWRFRGRFVLLPRFRRRLRYIRPSDRAARRIALAMRQPA